jgi:hypothetical protein
VKGDARRAASVADVVPFRHPADEAARLASLRGRLNALETAVAVLRRDVETAEHALEARQRRRGR